MTTTTSREARVHVWLAEAEEEDDEEEEGGAAEL
jgi:hypothetical protein